MLYYYFLEEQYFNKTPHSLLIFEKWLPNKVMWFNQQVE